jgi:SHS2 domain-containing protein
MNEHRFEYLEHTADKGVIGYGDTLEGALENIAYGTFMLMADLPSYQSTESRDIKVAADDAVGILMAWLKELLYVFEVDQVLPVEFRVNAIADGNLAAKVGVRAFGPDIEWLGQVKAVTYHEMKVEKLDGGYRVQAIVDV